MGTAQLAFASFDAPDERGLRVWRRFASAARAAHGIPAASDSAGARSYWRLYAPNFRELARSARLYPAPDDARRHAAVIAQGEASCTIHTFHAEAVRSIGWYIALDGEPVVICARWYQSLVIAGQAGARSLRALALVERRDASPSPAP